MDKEKKKMLKFPEGKLKWEDLPESVEFINLSNGHYHIKHITIPKNAKGFGPYSLNTCDSLKNITFRAPEPAECAKYIFEHAKNLL